VSQQIPDLVFSRCSRGSAQPEYYRALSTDLGIKKTKLTAVGRQSIILIRSPSTTDPATEQGIWKRAFVVLQAGEEALNIQVRRGSLPNGIAKQPKQTKHPKNRR
jgi:hypothetical protein